jgi:hypothetical protein
MKKRSLIPRHEQDYYRTPSYCVRALLEVEDIPNKVWEPACGDGAIARVLEREGHSVLSSDLIARGYGTPGIDFLKVPPTTGDGQGRAIVTNPPFALSMDFALHGLRFRPEKMALLLRLSWLEGQVRYRKLFAENRPARVWVFSSRVTMWHGDDPESKEEGGATPYAWFVWDSRPAEVTSVDWIETERHPDRIEDRLGALESSIVMLRATIRDEISDALGI